MRPSRNETLMQHARVAAQRATCSRQSVGVVLAKNGRVLVTGYNGAPAGMEHCDHSMCTCGADAWSGVHDPICAQGPCQVSVHAEANAVAYAARWGIKTEGAELFTTFTPCNACGQLIVNAGIVKVVYAEFHRDPRGLQLCQKAGIEVVHERDMDLIR